MEIKALKGNFGIFLSGPYFPTFPCPCDQPEQHPLKLFQYSAFLVPFLLNGCLVALVVSGKQKSETKIIVLFKKKRSMSVGTLSIMMSDTCITIWALSWMYFDGVKVPARITLQLVSLLPTACKLNTGSTSKNVFTITHPDTKTWENKVQITLKGKESYPHM